MCVKFGDIRGHPAEKVCHEWFNWPTGKQEGELHVKVGVDLKNLGADKHIFIIPAPCSTPLFELRKLCPFHTGRLFKFYDEKSQKFANIRFIGKNNLAKAALGQLKKLEFSDAINVINPQLTVSSSMSKLSLPSEAMTFNNCNVSFNFN